MLGASCHHIRLTTDASLMAWEAIMSGRSAQGQWKDTSFMTHQLPGDVVHVSCTETLSPRLGRPSCACPGKTAHPKGSPTSLSTLIREQNSCRGRCLGPGIEALWWSRFGGGGLVFISENDTQSLLVLPNTYGSS